MARKQQPPPDIDNALVKYESACRTVSTLTEAKEFRDKAEAMRVYARQAGNRKLERDAALVREIATRRLGQLINGRQASGELKQGRPKKHSQGECLSDIGITPKLAMLAQDTAEIPEATFDKLAYRDKDPKGIKHERVKLKRKKTHQAIKEKAAQRQRPEVMGPVCLIYADAPWTFSTYSEKGKDATSPDNHYETMTDEKIGSYLKDEKIEVHKDAALFLWCTASNIFRARAVMEAWGFTYKSQVVWVKPSTGTGYIFLEQHEILLYGTRGNMPAPMVTPPSVIFAPRGKKHSAKPPEARAMIEEMFPFFDTATRIELFARGEVPNWTVYGYEAEQEAAA